jgi:transposase-like protein
MEAAKKKKRTWTAEQKFNMLSAIEADIKSGLNQTQAIEKQGISYGNFSKWKKQLAVGVKSSLRAGKAPVDQNTKRLEREVDKLKEIIVAQSAQIAQLKKETNWD